MKRKVKPIASAFQTLIAVFPKGDTAPAKRLPPTDLRTRCAKPMRIKCPRS
jgi:hypothetical protein